ncbi:hypothetical protein MRGA327_16165 [Mycobacterium tuberculosis RGTB327]|nr:hypothetical protein MRGA327_16165 [Mycobacterium tuberculosis RGTB327]
MTTARDIMNAGVTCVGEHETLTAAAQYMREHDIGALPICGDDDRLHGMLTDRDIVIKGLAAGLDPNTATAGELARDSIYYVDANASIQEMLNVMEEHQVRRVPVISEHRLVGNRHRSRHRPTPARARHCAVRQGNLLAHGPRQLATSDHPPARKALSASIGGTQCVMRSRLGGSPGLW